MILKKDTFNFDDSFPFAIYTYTVTERSIDDSFHWHEFCEITLVMQGNGLYFANGEEYWMKTGDLIIFNTMEPHGWVKFKECMELLVMVFRSDFVTDEYLKPFTMVGSNFKNKISHTDVMLGKIKESIRDIYEEAIGEEMGYRLMIRAEVLRVLALLIRYYQDENKSRKSLAEKRKELARLEKAFEYIDDNYKEKLTLEEVAASCFMSPTYFSAYFKNATNTKFTEYVNNLRIQEAKRLLDLGEQSVTEIANNCGFNNISNFYKIYNRYFSTPPKQAPR